MALSLRSTVRDTEDGRDHFVLRPLKVGPSRLAPSRQQQEEVLASFGAFIGLGTGVAIGSVMWLAAILLVRRLL
jgi:hypothetical protein